MPSAGELLRAERTKRNRTLSEIADQTCISKRYLEAIEVDRVQDLPGEFFYKSFIRQYARALDLDDSTTRRILSSAVPCTTEDPVPVLNEYYENAQVGARRRWNISTGLLVGLLVGVLAACSALYAYWQHVQAQREAAAEAAPANVAQPAGQPPPTPAPQPSVPSAAAPAADTAASAPAAATPVAAMPQPGEATAAAPGQTAVEISASEPTWVSLSSEGKNLYAGILQPGDTKQYVVGATAKLTTGNAAGLELRVNGKPAGPIGPRGQVRIVSFAEGGFQITPPRPANPTQ